MRHETYRRDKMTRPKGTPNKKVATVIDKGVVELISSIADAMTKEPDDVIEINPMLQESKSDQSIKEVLLLIVDALYDKDGNAATWKPIRDKIEAL